MRILIFSSIYALTSLTLVLYFIYNTKELTIIRTKTSLIHPSFVYYELYDRAINVAQAYIDEDLEFGSIKKTKFFVFDNVVRVQLSCCNDKELNIFFEKLQLGWVRTDIFYNNIKIK